MEQTTTNVPAVAPAPASKIPSAVLYILIFVALASNIVTYLFGYNNGKSALNKEFFGTASSAQFVASEKRNLETLKAREERDNNMKSTLKAPWEK